MAGDIEFDEDAVLAQVNRLITLYGEIGGLRQSLAAVSAAQQGQWSTVTVARNFAGRLSGAIDETARSLERAEARMQASAQTLLDHRTAYDQQDYDVQRQFDALAQYAGTPAPTPKRV